MGAMEALSKIVEVLKPLSSEDRVRVFKAAMVMLGENAGATVAPIASPLNTERSDADLDFISPRARVWMKQNALTIEQLQEVFHLSDGAVEVVAPHMPGRNRKEQTYSAYLLSGLGQFLVQGVAAFDDRAARALCEASGCYDLANHSSHIKDRGNEFTGSKEKGWSLTTPGLRRAAELVRVVNKIHG